MFEKNILESENLAVTTTQLWNLTKEFIHDSGLVRQHIDSYNDFVERGLQAIVDEVGELPIEIGDYPLKIKLGKVEIGAPRVIEVDGTERSIYPAEARIRNLTYAAPLHMEMIPVIGEREGQPEMVYVGDLPVMLKSRICLLSKLSSDDLIGVGEDPLDPGGYFIVNGSERVIVALEDLAANRILVDVEHTGVNPTYKAKIFSTTVGFRARIEVTLKADGGTYVTMPGIPSDIPFMILMRALGFEEDAKVAELVSLDPPVQNELEGSFEKSLEATNQRDALLYLGNRLAPGQVDEYRLRFARLNDTSYWMYVFSGITAFASFFVPGGSPASGWTNYSPLTSLQFSPGSGETLGAAALIVLAASNTVGTVNILVTILWHRARGVSFVKLPMFTMFTFWTMLQFLWAFPSLIAGLIMLEADRLLGTSFFTSTAGGSILWDHVWWFFGHPEVYIVLLPAFGIVAGIIATFSGRPVY